MELQGFKSFPEKARLEFNPGITAVVGPNGSGKSNISDAIRWTLGEQSAKSLRGARMEDVIFAGTKTRRALNFAEVSLTLDNASRAIPLDYSEITVARRVYRTGEAAYTINGGQCRLRDVVELFMDTGVGRGGYSIIGQGQIDGILSVKSEERRLLFEEAAGIVKYKNRRKEAEARLERERANLVRVADIIEELKSRLAPLSEQAETAKRYLALSERLRLTDVGIFVRKAAAAQSDADALGEHMAALAASVGSAETERDDRIARAAALKNELREAEDDLERRRSAIDAQRGDRSRIASEISLRGREAEHIESDLARIARETEELRAAIADTDTALLTSESDREALTSELARLTEALASKEARLGRANAEVSESESEAERFAADHIEMLRALSESENRLTLAKSLLERLKSRGDELGAESAGLSGRIAERGRQIADYMESLADIKAEDEALSDELARLIPERDSIAARAAETDAAIDALNRELREGQARHKLLTELAKSYEGYYRSVKAVLSRKKSGDGRFAGVRGAVAELIAFAPEYGAAMEAALGAAAQNIITDTENDAKVAIEYLKSAKAGRATFLPITSVRGRPLDAAAEASFRASAGYVGLAKDLARYDARYEGVMRSLLGRVAVVGTLDDAIAFSRKHSHQYKCVTLDGDIMNAGGSMTGGGTEKTRTGILERGAELARLSGEIVRKSDAYDLARLRRDDLTFRAGENAAAVSRVGAARHDNELRAAAANASLAQARSALAELDARSAAIGAELGGLKGRLDAAELESGEAGREAAARKAGIEGVLSRIKSAQARLSGRKDAIGALMLDVTASKIEIEKTEGAIRLVSENIARAVQDKARGGGEIARRDLEAAELAEKRRIAAEDAERLAKESLDADARIERSATGLSEAEFRRDDIRARIEIADAGAMESVERLSRLKAETERLAERGETAKEETRRLFDEMWDNYGLTYQEALKAPRADDSVQNLEREARRARAEIKELGAVNAGAIDEYRSVRERYEFLEKQRGDITEAETKLKGVIAELTRLMEERFVDQFKLISESFAVVFAEMFGGGMAYLKLSDAGDALTSGIEIIAQPPGKSLQNMMLLSGGERALTAIALLFGILRLKPSPFCVLDEIEAALDDANVRRFANYLKNFARDVQFIIITHRKGTMEAADALYGVTMRERGVSAFVSVSLTDAPREAEVAR